MMLKVGITGGIGSGKSVVSSIFLSMGYPVYDADHNAKRLMNSHPALIHRIKSTFGDSIYNDKGLDRKVLAQLVFNNPEKLSELNGIVHPAVAQDFEEWVTMHQDKSIVFKEAAILFESGAYKNLDRIIGVLAPLDLRIERVMNRDGTSREEVERRIANQITQDEIQSRSHFIITNSKENLLLPQIVMIIEGLKAIVKDDSYKKS